MFYFLWRRDAHRYIYSCCTILKAANLYPEGVSFVYCVFCRAARLVWIRVMTEVFHSQHNKCTLVDARCCSIRSLSYQFTFSTFNGTSNVQTENPNLFQTTKKMTSRRSFIALSRHPSSSLCCWLNHLWNDNRNLPFLPTPSIVYTDFPKLFNRFNLILIALTRSPSQLPARMPCLRAIGAVRHFKKGKTPPFFNPSDAVI